MTDEFVKAADIEETHPITVGGLPVRPIDKLETTLLAAEAAAREKWRRDPLTYLRGYIDGLVTAHAMLKDARGDTDPPEPVEEAPK